jgi:hypothetical protein
MVLLNINKGEKTKREKKNVGNGIGWSESLQQKL